MSKFIKTALSNFSNLFQTNDNNTTINTSEYTIPPMQQENNENINNNDTIDFDSLLESTENITATDDKDSNNSDESKSITPEEVGATTAVFATSVLSGVAKIYEYIDDGVTWAGGKVVEGASWLVGESAGLFSEDKKNSIMNRRKDIKENVKNEIDRDKVGELNEWFYENTKIGQDINEASYLKYDSAVAKTTQNVTTKIGEIGAATALTILTGGAAAPLVFGVGCAEGIGKTAEKTYQNGGDFDDGTFSILLSGGLNGMSWVANGKLVQGAFEIIKDAASVGLLETGSTLLNDTLLNKEFWSNTIKNGLSLKTMSSSGNSIINVNALMNYGSSLMSIGGDFVDVLNSDEGFTPKNIMILGTRYLTALGLNVLEDSGREYISAYKSEIGKFKEYSKILFESNDDKIPEEFSNALDYKKKYFSLMVDLDNSNNNKFMDDSIIYKIATDKKLAPILNETKYLPLIFEKNIRDLNLCDIIQNYSYEKLNSIMSSDGVYDVINNMTAREFFNIIERYSKDKTRDILATDTIVNKLLNLTPDEISEVVNYKLDQNLLKSIELNLAPEKFEQFSDAFCKKYLSESQLTSSQEYFNTIIKLCDYKEMQHVFSANTINKNLQKTYRNIFDTASIKVFRQLSSEFQTQYFHSPKFENDSLKLVLKNADYSLYSIQYKSGEETYNKAAFFVDHSISISSILRENLINIYNDNFKLIDITPKDKIADIVDASELYKINFDTSSGRKSFYASSTDFEDITKLKDRLLYNGINTRDNFSLEKVNIMPSLKNVISYGANTKLFKANAYGGNQSDVYNLIAKMLSGEKLDDVSQYKAKLLTDILKKYYPNITEVQAAKIAYNYSKTGCGYMAIANAFSLYIDENKLYDDFLNSFGYDLLKDGSCNVEAIAFETYLKYVSNKYGDDIDELLKNKHGVSNSTFEKIFTEFFYEKGYGLLYDNSGNLDNMNIIKKHILNNENRYHIIEAKFFDMVQTSTKTIENNLDEALSNTIIENKYYPKVEGHAMLITDVDENDNIFVSSWKEKYQFFPDSLKLYKDGFSNIRSIKFSKR